MAFPSGDSRRSIRPAHLAALSLASVALLGAMVWFRGDIARPDRPAHGRLRGCNVLLITIDARAAPGAWFAWIHVFDLHAPYRAPLEYAAGRQPYDAEVAYTDRALDALDELRVRGHLDRTLVIVTADHGESLGEHGETTPRRRPSCTICRPTPARSETS